MSDLKTLLLIIMIVVIVVFCFTFILRKRKMNKMYGEFSKLDEEISKIDVKVINELERTKKILKNSENTELYNTWLDDYNNLKNCREKFGNLLVELEESKSFTQYQNFLDVNSNIEALIFEFKDNYEALYSRINKFTEFEQNNNTISIQLKTRLKEEQNRYAANLGHLKIYDESFNEQVDKASNILSEFEKLEREGHYIVARNILKECNEITQEIERTNKLITVFQNNFIAIRTNIKNLDITKNEVEKLNYQIDVSNFDEKILEFNERLDECVGPAAVFTFGKAINEDTSNNLISKLSQLDDDIKLFIPLLQKCFDNITKIIELRKLNDNSIETLATLASGALEERDIISKFYDVSKLKEIHSLDKEIARLKKFVEDYKKLEVLIYDAAEPYDVLLSRLEQSNKYLVRMIIKFKETIKKLEGVRNDELNAQDSLVGFRRSIINIELYLRKNNHLSNMSPSLQSLFKDVNIKYHELEEELKKEPLTIENVNNHKDSIEKLLHKIINDKLVKDVKQKEGCYYILNYIAKYIENSEIDNAFRRFEMLYNTHQYTLFLKEATLFFQSSDRQGTKIYMELVSKVKVEDYTETI